MGIGASTALGATSATAIGQGSFAAAANGNAVGHTAQTFASNGNAFGSGATVNAGHVNSTALGTGASTTYDNQIMLGTTTQTYTAPGITSALSQSRQTGPLQLATTDQAGNLAADGGRTFQTIAKLQAGVALALAAEAPSLTTSENFGVRIGWGNYNGEGNAVAWSAIGVMCRSCVSYGDRIAVDAAVGAGWSDYQTYSAGNVFGGRARVQWTWLRTARRTRTSSLLISRSRSLSVIVPRTTARFEPQKQIQNDCTSSAGFRSIARRPSRSRASRPCRPSARSDTQSSPSLMCRWFSLAPSL